MNTRAILGLAISTLVIGLLGGLAIGGDGDHGPENATGPGPTRKVAGVPVGFQQSEHGAVAAAAAYAESIGRLVLATDQERNAAIEVMAAPTARDQVRDGLKPGLETLAKGLSTVASADAVIRAVPVGYRFGAYSEEQAEIYLWAVGIVGSADALTPSATWGTTKITLRWVDGDWKLAANVEQTPGPVPHLNGAPSAADAFVAAAREFRSFQYAPSD